jgi:antirestriction protein ArdC
LLPRLLATRAGLQQQLQPKIKEAGSMSRDQIITDRIVAELEKGVRPWLKPWSTDHMQGRVSLPVRHNGIAYRGVNVVALWMQAMANGYAAPFWMTFKQALELGGGVRKGEKGSLVVYANSITRSETDEETGEESARDIHYMKGYTVFNVAQIDGLPQHYYAEPAPPTAPVQRIEKAENFFAATGANVVHGGTQACYVLRTDNIHMPCIDLFRDAESYYAVRALSLTPKASGRNGRLTI